MDRQNKEQLKKAFHQEMINLYKHMTKELKYKSTKLMDLINKYGGYEAAVKYITSEGNVQDFTVLWEHERLDLSVEALITKPAFRELFLDDIVTHCERKLAEYSYAPNKIEEEKEEYFDEIYHNVEHTVELREENKAPIIKIKPYDIYATASPIAKEVWKEIFMKNNIFSAKNQDMILRMYLMGDGIEAEDLSKEEGYSATYPYNEVISALSKRIKANLKVEVPVSREGKIIWWHLLFNGGFKDNTVFEWSLRKNLRDAITELVEEGRVVVDGLEVKTHKTENGIEEEAFTPQEETKEEKETIEIIEPEIEDKGKHLSTAVEETAELSDFDRLFESIMGISNSPKAQSETIIVKEEPKQVDKKSKAPEEINPTSDNTVQKDEALDRVSTQDNLLDRKKQECIDYYGAICDICGFDYGYTYGEAFEGFIDIHNSQNDEDTITVDTDPIKDLIPVCHNCHGIIHSQVPPLSVEKMRSLVKA